MAVAHDVSSTGSGNGSNALALSAMTTGGTNRGVLFIVHFSNTSTVSSISGGATATKIGSTVSLGGNGQIELWSCLETATITSQVYTVNTSGFPQLTCVASAYSGIDATSSTSWFGTPVTANSGAASSISANVTTTRANSLVVAGGGHTGSLSITAGTSQTLNATNPTTSGFSVASQERQNAVTSSSGTVVTGSFNLSGSGAIGIYTIEILAPAAASSTWHGLSMMGLGA